MTGLKYQPSKASEAYNQICLFFFYPSDKMVTTDFLIWNDVICAKFCLFSDGNYPTINSGGIFWQSETQE